MLRTGIGIIFFCVLFLFENPHFSACGEESEGDQVRNFSTGFYFPAAGKSIENQFRRTPQQVGLDSGFAGRINQYIAENPYTQRQIHPRWALWRHGYLVHFEGDFHKTTYVASLRKTWHAMIVGAAIKQDKIPSHQQKISQWLPELKGRDVEATWWHVMTQSAGFDYPYGYLTWVNTDGDLFTDADRTWACGRGAGGSIVLWNHKNGIVFAGIGIQASAGTNSIARVVESSITESNPLVHAENISEIGQWDRFEASIRNIKDYSDPYRDVILDVTYESPDGKKVKFWGFYVGDRFFAENWPSSK